MTNVNDWYAAAFKGWQVKHLGEKPTADMLNSIHHLGARPGKQALACAMALRPDGVTNAQIVIACGAPQLNKMRGFITDGLLKRLPHAPDVHNHQVYKLEVTAKGTKRIESALKREAEAAAKAEATPDAGKPAKTASKPKGKAKAKKATKVAKAETPTSEPATADQLPVPGPVIDQPAPADQHANA